MINYIWIGLIIVAVLYAGYRDITKDPASYTHDPLPVEAWTMDDGAWGDLPVEPEVTFEHPVRGESPAVRFDYDFSEGNRIEVDFRTELLRTPPDSDAPVEEIRIRVTGTGAGHRLRAEFHDANGERYFAAFSRSLPTTQEWAEGRFPLTGLTPAAENPTATPAWPLTLTNLILVRNPNAGDTVGSFHLAAPTYWYGRVFLAGQGVEAETWMAVITASSANHARTAINLAIGLIGIIMFWLGLMRIAEKAGLVQLIAKGLRPIMTRLFPDIPADGPAMGAIVMNIAANMLGLGNAATPLGLKAMEELQKVNPRKQHASNAQCMLLALNTSSVTIITPTLIGFRYAAGSTDIMKFWPVMIASTSISTIVAVTACKIYEKLPMFQIPAPVPGEDEGLEEEE